MPHAIRIHQTGGPEVLCWEAVDLPAPAPGEATVRHHLAEPLAALVIRQEQPTRRVRDQD